jgi:hypothetical protein
MCRRVRAPIFEVAPRRYWPAGLTTIGTIN